MRTLTLPRGTPDTFEAGVYPYPGAEKEWSYRTSRAVRAIRAKAPGVICSTYRYHGRTGKRWGIDIMVAPFRQKANPAQERFGDAITNFLLNNWTELYVNYIIWWDWMNDGNGWFSYEPWSKPASEGGWPGGDPDMDTRRHMDHVHVQILNPLLPASQ